MARGTFELLQIPGGSTVAVLLMDANGRLIDAPATATNWNTALDSVKSRVAQIGAPLRVIIEVETA